VMFRLLDVEMSCGCLQLQQQQGRQQQHVALSVLFWAGTGLSGAAGEGAAFTG
jgi:hypothetical protein